MVKICSAGGCTNHHYQKDKELSFFKFPDKEKYPERRARWVRACNRQNADGSEWVPEAKYIYMCSKHFITGKPNSDPKHPDYVPSVFTKVLTPRTIQKGQRKVERFNSAAKRRKLFSPSGERENTPATTTSDGDPEYTAVRFEETVAEDEEKDIQRETGFQRIVNETEREQFLKEIDNLRAERDSLLEQAETLRKSKFGADMVSENNEKCCQIQGLTKDMVLTLCHIVSVSNWISYFSSFC